MTQETTATPAPDKNPFRAYGGATLDAKVRVALLREARRLILNGSEKFCCIAIRTASARFIDGENDALIYEQVRALRADIENLLGEDAGTLETWLMRNNHATWSELDTPAGMQRLKTTRSRWLLYLMREHAVGNRGDVNVKAPTI